MKFLFIGGPLDGQRLEALGRGGRLAVPVKNWHPSMENTCRAEDVVEAHYYEHRELNGVEFYAIQGMEVPAILTAMRDNYHPVKDLGEQLDIVRKALCPYCRSYEEGPVRMADLDRAGESLWQHDCGSPGKPMWKTCRADIVLNALKL